MNNSGAHSLVVSEILALCGSRAGCRLWKNATGVGRGIDSDRMIRFGLPGSADIIGIGHGGLFLAIEVKTGSAKQTKEQQAFAAMITMYGGYYTVVSSAAEAESWLAGLGF